MWAGSDWTGYLLQAVGKILPELSALAVAWIERHQCLQHIASKRVTALVGIMLEQTLRFRATQPACQFRLGEQVTRLQMPGH